MIAAFVMVGSMSSGGAASLAAAVECAAEAVAVEMLKAELSRKAEERTRGEQTEERGRKKNGEDGRPRRRDCRAVTFLFPCGSQKAHRWCAPRDSLGSRKEMSHKSTLLLQHSKFQIYIFLKLPIKKVSERSKCI